MYYNKVANIVFQEDSLVKEYGHYILPIMSYLYRNTNREGKSLVLSLKDMIEQSGYKPKTGAGKINEIYRDILIGLQEQGYIETEIDLKKIKMTEGFSLILDIDFDGDYIQLYDSEIDTIMSLDLKLTSKWLLVCYYGYLKSRMYRRREGDRLEYGNKAESCYPSYEKITKDLGIDSKSILKYNEILVSLDMIRIGSAGRWYRADDKKKKLKEAVNTYVLYKDGWEKELKASIDAYKSIYTDRIFSDEDYRDNDRKKNGKKGYLISRMNNNKATEEEKQEYYDIFAM